MYKSVISAAAVLLVVVGWAPAAVAEPPDQVRVSVQQIYCGAEGAWCNPFDDAHAMQPSAREATATRERLQVLSELSLEPPVVPGLVEVHLAVDQLYCLADKQWCYLPASGESSLW